MQLITSIRVLIIMKIYLASKSPRRKELLEQIKVPFELLLVDTPELLKPNEQPEVYSKRVVQEKLDAAWKTMQENQLKPYPLLCADTEVVLDGTILGKPLDKADAFTMLKRYSGKTHQVITSVGLRYYQFERIRMNTTYVTFSEMNDEAIYRYIDSGNYQDKAGGYGIQSYISQFISRIDGCFYSVMGLPLNTVREMLEELKLFDKNLSMQ